MRTPLRARALLIRAGAALSRGEAGAAGRLLEEAVAVANRLLGVSGHAGRVGFAVRDALQGDGSDGATYGGIISGMLAEHLPEPRPLFAVSEPSPTSCILLSRGP